MSQANTTHRGSRAPLPGGFVEVRSPAASWLARIACAEAIARGEADRLLREPSVRDKRAGTGRGRVAPLVLGGRPAIGKTAMHGGLIGPLLGGLYLGAGRALAQVEIARRLAEAGITTPEILAVGWRRSFGFLRKLAIVARAIPAAENLYEAARRGASGPRRRAILDATAELVRAMHEAGFLHADLNVTNLVLGEDREGMRLHVIDLDRGRFVPVVSGKDRVAGLARLRRSYDKWIASSWPLTPREEIRFLRRYCRSEKSLVRDLRARLEAPRRGPRGRRP